jgi:DNA gyrase subunit B
LGIQARDGVLLLYEREFMSESSDNYKAENIKILKNPIDGIRWRPGMYLQGGTGIDGFHYLFFGFVNNAIEECKAGFADTVDIKIHQNGSVSITGSGLV